MGAEVEPEVYCRKQVAAGPVAGRRAAGWGECGRPSMGSQASASGHAGEEEEDDDDDDDDEEEEGPALKSRPMSATCSKLVGNQEGVFDRSIKSPIW